MHVTIMPQPLSGTLDVISSKSMSHRCLIAAGLADGTSHITHVLTSDDIIATKAALRAFGVSFEGDDIIGGQRKIIEKDVNVKESGSTLRFMIPIYLLDDHDIVIHGEGRLAKRPLDDYQRLFESKGVTFESLGKDSLPLKLKGKIKGGHYPIKGDVSSQFISGLLFALPLRREDSVIELLTPLVSKGYVDMTLSVLKTFGIHVLNVDQYYYIKGSQCYIPQTIAIEGDYSQAAFWIVAGLIGNKTITLNNLKQDSVQGDKEMIGIVKAMGGHIIIQDDRLIIHPSVTNGITIDLKDIPDLGPILMVLAARSTGKTTFVNCDRLRLKESNRLQAMMETLETFSVTHILDGDTLIVTGQETFRGSVTLSSHQDHRIAMAIAIASIRAIGPVTIIDAEAVQKSYPTFFDDFKKLGGMIQ